MHSQVMIHGDLKGVWFRTLAIMPPSDVPFTRANVMIDKDGDARLADFGLLTIVSDSTHPETTTSSEGAGTMRWMSPELLDPERFDSKNARHTRESDCYALGMVILEVLTEQAPFPCCSNMVVMRKIVEGERPDRPQGREAGWFTDDLWGMLEQCWSPKPKLRPTVESILKYLERGSATWEPLSINTDIDSQGDSDDQLTFTMSHHPCVFLQFVRDFHSPVQCPSQWVKLVHRVVTTLQLYRNVTPVVWTRTEVRHSRLQRSSSNQGNLQ